MPALSVIVPARNAADSIGATLDALAGQQVDGGFEVIVVDDGSEDATVEVAESGPLPVRILRQRRLGPGPARNRGATEAEAPVLAFTDADCVPAAGWLGEGLAAIGSADLVQGAIRPDPRTRRFPLDRTVWVDREAGLYETANLFVRRPLFDRIGGFDDWLSVRIGKPLAEDLWFGWRARRAGARTAFCERALVHHAVFEVGIAEFVLERLRLAYFPAIVAKVPELRETLLYGRLFISSRTAAFDVAVCGAVVAAGTASLWPLAATLPYAWRLLRPALGWRRHAPKVALANLAADATGMAALLAGSVRNRTAVL